MTTTQQRPATKGQDTRTRLLHIAQEAILAKGFDATSIDEIVAAAEITKSGFFYHFPDKNALARAVIERHIAVENAIFAMSKALGEPQMIVGQILLLRDHISLLFAPPRQG